MRLSDVETGAYGGVQEDGADSGGSRFESWRNHVKYLVGVILMLVVITVASVLDSMWTTFPAIGVAAGASFVIGTKVK